MVPRFRYSPAAFVRLGFTALALAIAQGAAGERCADPDSGAFWRSVRLFDADESVPVSERPPIRAKVERTAALFGDLYPRPRLGENSLHSGSITAYDEIVDGPWSFELDSQFKPRYCDSPAGRLDDPDFLPDENIETRIQFNSLHLLLKELENVSIDGQPVYSLARRVGALGGHDVYRAESFRTGNAILFTHGGRLPVKPVSQRKYLEAARAQLQATPSEQSGVLDELEANLRQQLEEARRQPPGESRDQLVAAFEQGLADIQSQRPVGDARLNASISEEVAIIDKYLAAHSAQELEQPAITHHSMVFSRGAFPSLDEEGAYSLVQIDDDYFDSSLPRSAAQLMVLFWEWELDDPAPEALEWRARIEAKFPIEGLQGMIDR